MAGESRDGGPPPTAVDATPGVRVNVAGLVSDKDLKVDALVAGEK
jgi:hypothetical protein